MNTTERISRLRARMAEDGLDAMLIFNTERSLSKNVAYYSGFRGTHGWLWITADDAALTTDFRYTEQAAQQAPDYRVIRMAAGYDWFSEVVSASGARSIGIEDESVTVAAYKALTEKLQALDPAPKLVSTADMADQLRAVKDAAELETLIKAIEIADEAVETVAAGIRPGMTERQIAWDIERAMRSLGADGLSFPTIVASGPNGAKAHHSPTDRVLEYGDGVYIDTGALYEGYCSDITRAFVLGEASPKFREIYDLVLAAQEAAEANAKAGMTGGEIDGIARAVIAEAGYGDDFGHSLGHGIGIAVHELPRVGPTSDDPIEDGMVFSVEPGIYLNGWGGVRIEDLVVMENGKPRILTKAHKRDVIPV
ncbi:MAG: aminopeptidase P family protein [Chloroflexi bacterium]|nr:aminopeptidase P family protein [Chloroflexota bacterium]MYB84350.1 aminopeptidase P family protein [Chloroflexota bacterium]